MLAMGMLSDEAVEGGFCGRNLGIECAGIVVTTGEGVSNLAVGQRSARRPLKLVLLVEDA